MQDLSSHISKALINEKHFGYYHYKFYIRIEFITDIIMETTVFNPIQRHLLEMFSYDKSQEGLEELKEVLFQYYSKRMNTKLDELWDKGILDQKKLDEIAEMDIHSLK